MKWNETIAKDCRYGHMAGNIFHDAEIIYDGSTDDYQGEVNILAKMPNDTFVHFEYVYGSCSGCDAWEDLGLTDEQIEIEMRRTMAILRDVDTLKNYLRCDRNKQLHGMERLIEMSEAFIIWEARN